MDSNQSSNSGSIQWNGLIRCDKHNPNKILGSVTADGYIKVEVNRKNYPIYKFAAGTVTCDCGHDVYVKTN